VFGFYANHFGETMNISFPWERIEDIKITRTNQDAAMIVKLTESANEGRPDIKFNSFASFNRAYWYLIYLLSVTACLKAQAF
jgi:hypothetical protein